MPEQSHKTKARLTVLVAILGPWLWLFGSVLFSSQSFVFRDAAHYYYPLFKWTAKQWGEGQVPLWNPQENLGVPQLADNTASVFYPGKLIFALPIGFAARYKLYIVLHVLGAAAASYLLARHCGSSVLGSGIAALSYAFGGSVVFQYCNVVFLVGAAWLPVALLAADRMLVQRSWTAATLLGAVLALITLGGDPQTAYHVGLLAGLYALFLWLADRRRRRRRAPAARGSLKACLAIASMEAGRDVVREGEAPAEPSWHRQVGSAREYPARQEPRPPENKPRPPENRKLLAVLTHALSRSTQSPPALPRFFGSLRCLARHRITLLLLAAGTGAVFAAVQILPSARWTLHSHRAASRFPRSLYEVAACLSARRTVENEAGDQISPVSRDGSRHDLGNLCRGLLGPPEPGTHHADVFQFSVGPWRWAEFLWPNVSGQQFPVHRRWIEIVPAEGRVWSPSLYLGLLPVVLGVASIRLRAGAARRRWLSWTVLLAILGGLGVYGMGWLVGEIRFAMCGQEEHPLRVGRQVGGLYWWMTIALPGYVLFRYPAKLLSIATLAIALLAARGWDRVWSGQANRIRPVLAALSAISLAAAVVVLAARPWIETWLAQVSANDLFGPLDVKQAWRDMWLAFVHTSVLGSLFWYLLSKSGNGNQTRWATLTLLLCAVDVTIAQRWLVPGAPQATWCQQPLMAQAIQRNEQRQGSDGSFRVFRAASRHLLPPSWKSTASEKRQREGLQWDHATLFPKYHLASGLALVRSSGPFMASSFEQFLDVARRNGSQSEGGSAVLNRMWLDSMAAKYLVLPAGISLDHLVPVESGTPPPENARLWYNPTSLPRAWIVHDIEQMPELPTAELAQVIRRSEEVLFPHGQARDLRWSAVVECNMDFRKHANRFLAAARQTTGQPECRIVLDEPQHVELLVDLTRSGLVVLSDLFYPGWEAYVQNGTMPAIQVSILRTNRVMRGVYLPAGRYRLVFRYRPGEFYCGVAISVCGWLALLGALVVVGRRVPGSFLNRRHRKELQ